MDTAIKAIVEREVAAVVAQAVWVERQVKRAREYQKMLADLRSGDAVKSARAMASWEGREGCKVVSPKSKQG